MSTVNYYDSPLQLEEHTSGTMRTFIPVRFGAQLVNRVAGTLANLVNDFKVSHTPQGVTKSNPRGTKMSHNLYREVTLVRDNLIVGKMTFSVTVGLPVGNYTVASADILPALSDLVQLITCNSDERAHANFADALIESRV